LRILLLFISSHRIQFNNYVGTLVGSGTPFDAGFGIIKLLRSCVFLGFLQDATKFLVGDIFTHCINFAEN
jgi:hypothetical protein